MERGMSKMKKQFSNREISDFCSQLSMVLDAGMSLSEGLYLLSEDCSGRQEQEVLQALQDGMDRTGRFCSALEQAGVFPEYMIRMVHLGEQTGHLDDVMQALTEHYDREDSLKKSIRSAVAYPVMMLCMMALIVAVLLTRVLPIFNQVFVQLGTELTGLSQGLMHLGTGIRHYAAALVGIAAALAAGGILVSRLPGGKMAAERLFGTVPVLRRIYDRVGLCRFASGMALALSSGLNPEYALELARDLCRDTRLGQRLDRCLEQISNGESFSSVILGSGIFPGLYGKMIAIGEKTGTMDQTMGRIAEQCREEVDDKVSGALRMIEPTLVVILSVLVGIILMSVMFPLLGIMSGL